MSTVKAKNTKTKVPVRILHRHFKMAFVPHAANQYRPHFTRRISLMLVVALVLGSQLVYDAPTALGMQQAISAADLLSATNQQRQSHHISPVKMSPELAEAASLKAQNMLDHQYWAHTSPDGTTPWHWFEKVGYSYAYAGENLAKDFTSVQAVTTAWMNSPEHRANVLNAHYTQVGFASTSGVLGGKVITLVVALYGQPAPVLGATTAASTAMPAMSPAMSAWMRMTVAIQSFTPAAFLGLIALTGAAIVASSAHLYRSKLPKKLRQTPYRNHGLYKAAGLVSFAIAIISLYGSSQI
jgi:uncharacterized protein YkwD